MLGNPLDSWLQAHPLWSWSFAHPTWALVCLGGILLLGWGIFRAIARLLEQSLVALLRTPLALLAWLWRQVFRRPAGGSAAPGATPQDQLQERLAKLKQLQAEAAVLTQEIQALLDRLPRSGDRPPN